jgi:hypothetical protein
MHNLFWNLLFSRSSRRRLSFSRRGLALGYGSVGGTTGVFRATAGDVFINEVIGFCCLLLVAGTFWGLIKQNMILKNEQRT